MNAERHGILSTWAVMDGEDQACFIQLSHNLSELFQPADEHEANLVEIMLTSVWRRHRAMSMETCGFSFFHRYQTRLAEQHNNPSNNPYDLAFAGLSASLANSKDADARALELLHRYEIRHTRAYTHAVKDLFAYRKLRGVQPIPTFDQSAAEQDAPTISPTQPSIATQPQTEPRAQASGPQIATNAAPPHATQRQIQPNEPRPVPTPQKLPNEPKPHSNHPATSTQPPAEPRAQASVPGTSTNAAPPPTQQRILPNEPGPVTSPIPQKLPNGPKPHSNHPARNKFKKNRRRR